MTRARRTRCIALLLVGGCAIYAMAGCGGGSDFKDKPRPAVPVQLSGVITDKAVSVEPDHLGAGPVVILISNQSVRSHTVTLEGGPHNTVEQVGPINPLDTGRIQQTLDPGTYTVTAGSDAATSSEIKSATLRIGKARASSSGTVLLP
jgi:hypothetical protein